MKWTDEQLSAVNAGKGNWLVSASAGSGKTSVLTERAFRLIKEGTPLDALLVLTFTDNAAAVMRERIRERLLKAGELEKAASIDAVSIKTFDAFALALVRKYYYLLGVSRDVKIVDESIMKLEKRKILDGIFARNYEDEDEDFLALVHDYALKDDAWVRELILELDEQSDLEEDKSAFFSDYERNYLSEEFIRRKIGERYAFVHEKIVSLAEAAGRIGNKDYALALRHYLSPYVEAGDFDALAEAFRDNKGKFPPSRGNLYKLDEDDKPLKEYIKKTLTDRLSKSFNYGNADEIVGKLEGIKPFLWTIFRICRELDEKADAFKRKYDSYTFSDIARLARDAVKIDGIREELRRKYRYIMIDEYQDTSDLQEELISRIANGNVFSVGDVKQSIYRFRNADPSLFLRKYEKYEKEDGGRLIILPDNFRSRKELIEDNNRLFAVLMKKEDAGIDYGNGHAMRFGNRLYERFPVKHECHHEAIFYDEKPEADRNRKEATLIAEDIQRRIDAHEKILDGDRLRDVTYKDFAILIAAKTHFDTYREVFNDHKIPLYAKSDLTVLENDLVMVLRNIVKLIIKEEDGDHSGNYLHLFLSIMRSFLFREDDQLVEKVALSRDYSLSEVEPVLRKIAAECLDLSLSEVFSLILKRFDVYEKLVEIGDVREDLFYIAHFHEIAREMEDMNYSLRDFADYFDGLENYKVDLDISGFSAFRDSVKLMSVHAAKGLEFKIVYLAGLSSRFMHDTNKYAYSKEYGVALPNFAFNNPEQLFQVLISDAERRASLRERLRILYVALTRAEEKAVVIVPEALRRKTLYSFDDVNSLGAFLTLAGNFFTERKPLKAEEEEKETVHETPEFAPLVIEEPIRMSEEQVVKARASKARGESDPRLLALGDRFHHYLELLDFRTKDVSFIKDPADRKIIGKFIGNPIFADLKNATVRHEFPFYDEETGVRGAIDLLIRHEDHVDIIDYKLSKIEDALYDRQLGIYKEYISKITDLPIDAYVVSILTGAVRKVS